MQVVVHGHERLAERFAREELVVAVREVVRVAAREDEQRRKAVLHRRVEVVGARVVAEQVALRLAGAVGVVRLEARRLRVAADFPDDLVVVEHLHGARVVAPARIVADRAHVIRAPGGDDAAVVQVGEAQDVRILAGRDIDEPDQVLAVRDGKALRCEGGRPEVAGGLLRAEVFVPPWAVEAQELRRIGEGALDDHERLAVAARPLRRPVGLFLQRRAVALVVHGAEDAAAAGAGVLEQLARGVDRAHRVLREARPGTGGAPVGREVVRVGELGRLLHLLEGAVRVAVSYVPFYRVAEEEHVLHGHADVRPQVPHVHLPHVRAVHEDGT